MKTELYSLVSLLIMRIFKKLLIVGELPTFFKSDFGFIPSRTI